ncbi:MAG: hypothetical protein ACRDVM_10445 [Acidimicrobiia bacterium]
MTVKDPSLAPEGIRKIEWAATWSPVFQRVRDRFEADGSLKGRRIGVILPLEPKLKVRDENGTEIGSGSVTVSAPLGQR